MRLIDADALKSTETWSAHDGVRKAVYASEIDNAPTILVPERSKGKWKHEHLCSTSGGTYEVVRCSECAWQYPMWETKYCPNCGAEMECEE